MRDADRAIGQRLRQIRWARGLTQADIAGIIGCSHQAVSRIEIGKVRLSLGDAMKICRRLNISITEFVAENGADVLMEPEGAKVAIAYGSLPPHKQAAIRAMMEAMG